MHSFRVIYEQGPDSWSAYSPDLPGCIAAGSSREEVERLMREAVEAHIDLLETEGLPVPKPTADADDSGSEHVPSRRRLLAAASGHSGRTDISQQIEAIMRAETTREP